MTNETVLTLVLKVGDAESGQLEALTEGVGDAVLLLAEYLGNDQYVIEEEHFTLVDTGSLTPAGIHHLIVHKKRERSLNNNNVIIIINIQQKKKM